jgi:TBC1 domain family member 20
VHSFDSDWKTLATHRDEEQVQRDVDRAFVHYPNSKTTRGIIWTWLTALPDEPEKTIEARKRILFDLIIRVLRNHPSLCYFQGFHDIAQVLMLVLGADSAYPAIEAVSLLRIRDYMLPSMTPALKHLQLLPAILQAADPEVASHLTLPHVHYALPATLTLYAHEIEQYSDIARLFDFILAHEPVMSVYLFAATILSRRDKLLEIPAEDHDMLFFTLQKLPQPLDLEPLITHAGSIFAEHPPSTLTGRVWRGISSSSVLKTARVPEASVNLKKAAVYFQRQAAEVKWEETKHKAARTAMKYRRPAATTAAAIAIGALSIWMRRSGNDRYLVSLLFSLIGAGTR